MIKFRPGARTGAAPRLRLRAVAAGMAVTGMLIAACGSGLVSASRGVGKTDARQGVGKTGDCDSLTTCYTPHQLRVAYGIQPLLDRGIDGRGETVVLPELASSRLSPPQVSDIRQDFSRFDSLFGLPAPRLRVVTTLAGPVSPLLADQEEVLDLEMVHVVAPGAAIVVDLVKATALNNPGNAIAAAVAAIRPGLSEGGVISISAAGQTGGEHCDTRAQIASLHSALQAAARHHVTVVAASGDVGAATRGVPDVAADASGHSGMALAISDGGGKFTIRNSGGTSASAPIWAGLIALADQYAGRHLGFVNPAIYRIGRSAFYRRAFHDITRRDNTVRFPPKTITGFRAAAGWDPVTGWGSPDARVLIPLLARYARS
jgi:subtilase family serine protease